MKTVVGDGWPVHGIDPSDPRSLLTNRRGQEPFAAAQTAMLIAGH
jgi:hypothetical protein